MITNNIYGNIVNIQQIKLWIYGNLKNMEFTGMVNENVIYGTGNKLHTARSMRNHRTVLITVSLAWHQLLLQDHGRRASALHGVLYICWCSLHLGWLGWLGWLDVVAISQPSTKQAQSRATTPTNTDMLPLRQTASFINRLHFIQMNQL